MWDNGYCYYKRRGRCTERIPLNKGKRKVEKVKNELAQVLDKKKEKKDLRNTEIVFK